MHIGNLRSALYSYLIAKSLNGKFILRIEDTDKKRQVLNAEKIIYDTMRATNLEYDEGPEIGGEFGPYIQSDRKKIYVEYAKKLIDLGGAYYCFCEKHENLENYEDKKENNQKFECNCKNINQEKILEFLSNKKSYVIRQKMPKSGKTSFEDLVFGHVEIENSELEDQILIKSDGMPTYNFANVIDDHLMQISHVIRGCEYLSATPKYNLLYKSFGWEIPKYVHLPLIMGKNPDGSITKLSKRAGAVSFLELTEEGYLPEAIVNYIAFLGWCPSDNQEIFSLKELEQKFSIKNIGKSPAIFDYEKLAWVNEQHIKLKSDEGFAGIIKKYVDFDIDLLKLAKILKPRVSKLRQIPEIIKFLKELPDFDLNLLINKKNKTDKNNILLILEKSIEILNNLSEISDWDNNKLFEVLSGLSEQINLKKNSIMWVVRVAVSGQTVTPGGATEILELLGKSESLLRLKKILNLCKNHNFGV
jgi:glutamyl-tRNA synthetase